MKVCIAEKPSVAREIAEVLGATQRMNGYIEGNGYQVTWTFGHLCTLKEPHEYAENWKRWSLGSLPMIPPRFGIKLIENPTYEQQFKVIESLMQNAEMVINCGDAGQEGELIQRWVMQKAGCKCPVYRLWISSLTEEAIREGFQKLKEQTEFNKLYEAGLSRGIIIHLRPVFSGRGRFAERSFPVFPPIIVFRIDMEFSGMQIQYRSCVISLIPSRPKRNI